MEWRVHSTLLYSRSISGNVICVCASLLFSHAVYLFVYLSNIILGTCRTGSFLLFCIAAMFSGLDLRGEWEGEKDFREIDENVCR